jgi:adenosine deaminase CECR1
VGAGIKANRMQLWAVDWEKFCLWIVDEYGEQYGDGGHDVHVSRKPCALVADVDLSSI